MLFMKAVRETDEFGQFRKKFCDKYLVQILQCVLEKPLTINISRAFALFNQQKNV